MIRNELHKSLLEKSHETFSRSGGKGGQNVNKVNTKVHLTIPVADLGGLSDDEKNRLRGKLSSIINGEDCLYLDADEERFQERNRVIALERLENRIVSALVLPKKRKKTRPTKSSVEKRLKFKKMKSEIKKARNRKWI